MKEDIETKTYITWRMVKPHREFFCRECGLPLIETLVGAENYYEEYPECGKSYPYHKYNQKTGKRQYVYRYKCWNKRFFNNHDDFIEDEIITF